MENIFVIAESILKVEPEFKEEPADDIHNENEETWETIDMKPPQLSSNFSTNHKGDSNEEDQEKEEDIKPLLDLKFGITRKRDENKEEDRDSEVVNKKLKQRRQNAWLRKILHPKNAIMELNELKTGIKFSFQEHTNALTQTMFVVNAEPVQIPENAIHPVSLLCELAPGVLFSTARRVVEQSKVAFTVSVTVGSSSYTGVAKNKKDAKKDAAKAALAGSFNIKYK